MAIKDYNLSDVFKLVSKTMPFIILRFVVYFGITIAYIIFGIGGMMIGNAVTKEGNGILWGGILGMSMVAIVARILKGYILYLVKAGHIAVLVELMDGRELPDGKGQISYAQQKVKESFWQATVLFGVDQLIKAILKTFNRIFFSIANMIPIPGLQGVISFANKVINNSLTYLDEVILAYNFRVRSQNPWKSSQSALILYAQNYKAFLKNAVSMTIMIWLLTGLVFIVVMIPVLAIASGIESGVVSIFGVVFAYLFAVSLKRAIIEPVAMTALMLAFFKVTEGQVPNPEWEAKLDSVSKKFGELKKKALEWGKKNNREQEAAPSLPPA